MKNRLIYLTAGLPIPKTAVLSLLLLSLAYTQIADPLAQLSGYWPGVDVSAASRSLLLGVGIGSISAWVSQRWTVGLRMERTARSGWEIAVRDLLRLYSVMLTVFVIDYAILVAYRMSARGAGTPKLSVVFNGAAWILLAVTVGWAIGSRVQRASAVFVAAAAMVLLSIASVMANDGHRGFPLLAGRQLPALPSYAVEFSPSIWVTIIGIATTVVCSFLTMASVMRRRHSLSGTAAIAAAVLLPMAASVATGGRSWLQPRAAAVAPLCVGDQLQVCSWQEDAERLETLHNILPRLTEAMQNTGYATPGRLSVSGAVTDAEAQICPFRDAKGAIVNILGRVPVGSSACIGSDRLEHCVGDAGPRENYLALSEIYTGWLANYPLESDKLPSIRHDGELTEESRVAERVLTWPKNRQFEYMSQAYASVTACDPESVHALLEMVGYR